jgi:hypothetical protein
MTDWSVLIALGGVVVFFFGKIISEISPQREEHYSNYVAGLFFSLTFIAVPAALLLMVLEKVPYYLPVVWAVIIQLILLPIHSLRVQMYQVEKLHLTEKVHNLTLERTEKIYKELPLPQESLNHPFLKKALHFAFNSRLPDMLLWLLVAAHLWLTISIVRSSPVLVLSLLSGLSLLLVLSSTAFLKSWYKTKPYPDVKVHLDDGTIYEGELWKIENDFVTVHVEDKILHLAKDRIRVLEKSIWKKEAPKGLEKAVRKGSHSASTPKEK